MRTTAPQRERAEALLRSYATLPVCQWPSMRELAQKAGVSVFTIHSAIQAARSRGALPPRVQQTARHAPATVGVRWRTVADALLREIALGHYPRGERLPGRQELCAQFGVSPPTVRRALAHLQLRDVVQGRCVADEPGHNRLAGSATLVLLTASDAQGLPVVLSQRTEEFLRALERECTSAHIALHIEGYAPADRTHDTSGYVRRVRAVCDAQPVVGCVLLQSLIEPSPAITLALAAARIPVVVLEERPWERPVVTNPRSRVHILRLGYAEHAGLALGRFVAAQGHRTVAYVNAYPDDHWSTLRLNGLREALQAVGGTVEHAALDETARAKLAGHLRGMSRRMAEQAVRLTSTPRAARAMQDTLERLTYDEFLRMAVEPIAQRLSTSATCTAWVAANDQVALALRDLLTSPRSGLHAPSALCGFDNSEPARYYGLTTVDFNLGAAAHAAVWYLIRLPRAESKSDTLEIPVSVIPRASTRPPDRASRTPQQPHA